VWPGLETSAVLEIVAKFHQIGGKKMKLTLLLAIKKWILGVPCSPDWRQEIKFIGRQLASGWLQKNNC
jgi:hypothetical protein